MMSTQAFLTLLAVGAAGVAFWLVARLPERGPADFGRAMGHVVLAILLGGFAPQVVAPLAAHGYAMMMVAVFGVVFPVLVYTFLAAAWFLKLAHGMIAKHR